MTPAVLDLLRALAPEARFAWDGLYCVELRQGSNFDASLRLRSLPRAICREAAEAGLLARPQKHSRRVDITEEGRAALAERRAAA